MKISFRAVPGSSRPGDESLRPASARLGFVAAGLAALVGSLAGCRTSTSASTSSPTSSPAPSSTLTSGGTQASDSADVPSVQSQLDARRAAFTASAPAETVAVYDDGVRQVADSRVMRTALREGAKAPDFELPVAGGGTLQLSTALESGPVVLTWYRGGWCPYCTLQLKAYAGALDEFTRRGATVVAIGPEVPASAVDTMNENGLPFPVLSDRGNNVAAVYGIGYRLPQNVIDQFTGRLDLPGHNGDTSWTLPLAVTYVIDQDRTIRWAFVDPDYRRRAETSELLRVLDEINAAE